MPTEDRVSSLVAVPIGRRGYDLEGVRINAATVTVMVDGDGGIDLDAIAALSEELSGLLDEQVDFGQTPYTLEVTTRGVGSLLTLPRHWRRSRGRKARLTLADGSVVVGRIGLLTPEQDAVALIVAGRGRPSREQIPLSEVTEAVVQVEFSAPDPRELELAAAMERSGRASALNEEELR
jgi:ribosome maturation factor RimP